MYKDVAKWLLGLVPITTLASLGLALAPSADVIGTVGLWNWLEGHQTTAVSIVAILVATIAMVATCAHVLLAGPTEWDTLWNDDHQVWRTDAFATHAVGRPYFYDASEFHTAELASHADSKDERKPAVEAITSKIVALSSDLNAKTRLKRFLVVFGVGVIVVFVGVIAILTSASPLDEVITAPIVVGLHVPAGELDEFTEATGCSTPSEVEALAVSGTWRAPHLRLFGDGCTDDEWSPDAITGVLVTRS